MAQYIKNANIFGRIGSNIGKGLAESIPKEVERNRMTEGLKELGGKQGLTPFEQYAGLIGIPGVADRPQIVQTGGELLKHQGIAQGFRNAGNQQDNANQQNAGNPLRNAIENKGNQNQQQTAQGLQPNPSGLVSPSATRATLEHYIPKNRDQLLQRAGDLYDQNRQLYPNPEMAFQAAVQEDAQNQAINQAQQGKRNSQIGVEDRARGQLSKLREAANVEIPDNVYQQVENDVLDKISNGEGETEATKYGQKKLDEISRQYKALDTIGNLDYMFRDTKDIKRNLRDVREPFKERGDLENLADSYISKQHLSPGKGYYLAFPPSDIKELNNELVKLPNLNTNDYVKKFPNKSFQEIENLQQKDTLEASKRLAKAMGKDGSPLAIGEELKAKGYDPSIWFDYLGKNRKSLDLSERQGRELEKPKNAFPTLNDNWLFFSSGLDKLVEQ